MNQERRSYDRELGEIHTKIESLHENMDEVKASIKGMWPRIHDEFVNNHRFRPVELVVYGSVAGAFAFMGNILMEMVKNAF